MSDRASAGPVLHAPRPRRSLRLAWMALATALALIAAAALALALVFPPARVRALVQAQITRTLRREARFERAAFWLWPPVRLTVEDAALAEPGGFAAGTAFRARAIHVDLDLLGLLQRRLVARSLEVVEPFAHVVLGADGTSNFDQLAAAPRPGGAAASPPFDLLVQELRLRGGRLQLDDLRAQRRIVLGLDARLGFWSEGGGARIGTSGDWTISDLAFGPNAAARLSDLNRSLAGLTWKLEHRGRFEAASRRLTLDRLALVFGRSELTVAGVVDDPGPHAILDLNARGDKFDVAQLLGFLAAADVPALGGVKGSGEARFDLAVAGRMGQGHDPEVNGRLVLSDATVESPALPKKVEGISGTIEFSPAYAEVRSFTARAGKSSFTLGGNVTRPLALFATVGRVAPADVRFRFDSPYLDLAELIPPGPTQPSRFNARGGGEVAIARLRSPKLDVRDVKGTVVLAPNRVEVPSFTLAGYGGAVSGKASFGLEDPARPSFALRARADSIEANDFLSAWTPAAGVLNGTVNAEFDLSGSGSQPKQMLENLTAIGLAAVREGHLRGPTLDAIAKATGVDAYRDLRFNDLHLPFRVERGRVVTDPVQLAGPYGDWRLVGAIGFDGTLDYAVSITLPREVTARLGSPAALAAVGLTDARGRTLLDLNVTGRARSPRVALNTNAMRDRLAGRANAAAAEQREKLAREALEGVLGKKFKPDSTGKQPSLDSPEVQQEIRKKAGALLEGLFGKKKPQPQAAPPAESAAARDSAGR